MAESTDATAARRAAILDAARAVFLRYGFKKTSMDDLARAAGLSRQGLYLHYRTKEELFRAAVQHLIEATRAAGKAALAGDDNIEARLLAAFEAVHGKAIGRFAPQHMAELLATTLQIVGPVYAEYEAGFVADVARALRGAGVVGRWKDAGVTAQDLAEHLHDVSCGIKHRVATPAEYRDRMRVAVRIVCRR
jgi:AcrR family transcriptional regulator